MTTAPGTEPVIEISGLDFSYNPQQPILSKVNISVAQFTSTCIVGPNGGGKSTLVKLILGLLRPDRGRVLLLGGPPEVTRSQVGYVPQYAKFDPLFPVSALDVTLMGRLDGRARRYGRADYQAAHQALAEMGMDSQAQNSFAELSGGQQQRVLIARALTSAVKLLIMDEPTASIDAQVEGSLMEILQCLSQRMAVVLVTHDLGFTSKFFQSVICVHGQVHIHPTSEITGKMIQDMYGNDSQMIRHDHRCSTEGHTHV